MFLIKKNYGHTIYILFEHISRLDEINKSLEKNNNDS
jgi:hypothetical protein